MPQQIDVPELPPELEEVRNEWLSGYRTYLVLATGIAASLSAIPTGGLTEMLPVEVARWGEVIEYVLMAGIMALAAFYKAKTTKIGILAKKKIEKLQSRQ